MESVLGLVHSSWRWSFIVVDRCLEGTLWLWFFDIRHNIYNMLICCRSGMYQWGSVWKFRHCPGLGHNPSGHWHSTDFCRRERHRHHHSHGATKLWLKALTEASSLIVPTTHGTQACSPGSKEGFMQESKRNSVQESQRHNLSHSPYNQHKESLTVHIHRLTTTCAFLVVEVASCTQRLLFARHLNPPRSTASLRRAPQRFLRRFTPTFPAMKWRI